MDDEVLTMTKGDLDAAIQAVVEKTKAEQAALLAGPQPSKMQHGVIDTSDMLSPEDQIAADPKGGFKNMGHYFFDVAKTAIAPGYSTDALSRYNNAMTVTKTAGYMEEGSGPQGGYGVPVEFRAELLAHSMESQIVKPRATKIPMASNRIEIPCMVDSDHSSNFYGGITIYRKGEGATRTVSNPTYGKVALTLHEQSGMVYITNELLEDSAFAMAAIVKKQFTESIGFQEDDDYLNGTGAYQALGCINSKNPCLVTVTAVTGQGASTIIAENVIDMWAQLHPRFQNTAIWIANIETFPQIATMNLSVGTGGIPVYMPAGGLANSPYASLMGRPIIYTEKCQALGTAGDIALCAFSEYLIGVKSGAEMNMAESMHVRFATNEMAYRFIMRTDGQPWWQAALTPRRGSNDLSCFIVLNSTRT